MKVFYAGLALAIYSGLTFYIGWNAKALLQAFHLYHWPILFWILLYLISFGFLIGRLHGVLSPFSIIGNYWMFILQYGLILCMLANLLVWWTPLTTKMVGSGVVVTLFILFIIGTYNAYSPIVRNLTITVDKPGDDLRVVMASDFHLGTLSHKGHLQKFVDLSNAQNPDLVLLAGDIVDDSPRRFLKSGMGDVMKQLDSTYGVYGILGNHEYYGKEIPLFIEAMKDAHVKILLDETILIENRFYLTGREDITNKGRLPLTALKPENEQLPWLVMNHTPNDLDEPTTLGVDLHVSGHTHKGQMWPNHLIIRRIFELDYGHLKKVGMHAIVSSGFGFWGPPTRIGSRSELWVIDVQFTRN